MRVKRIKKYIVLIVVYDQNPPKSYKGHTKVKFKAINGYFTVSRHGTGGGGTLCESYTAPLHTEVGV